MDRWKVGTKKKRHKLEENRNLTPKTRNKKQKKEKKYIKHKTVVETKAHEFKNTNDGKPAVQSVCCSLRQA